jgi:hypothetical protein
MRQKSLINAPVQAGLGRGPVRQEPARLVGIGARWRPPDHVFDGGDPPVARVRDMFAIGGGGEAGDPQVDTDRGSGRFEGPGGHLVAGQDQHPAAPLMANLDGLDPAFHSAVDADLYLSDSLQVHPAGVRLPTAAITVLGPVVQAPLMVRAASPPGAI